MKASDISDDAVLSAMRKTRGRYGVPHWSTLGCIEGELTEFHPKVVLAKLRSMIRRKVIEGCGCGCRGDFRMPYSDAEHPDGQ